MQHLLSPRGKEFKASTSNWKRRPLVLGIAGFGSRAVKTPVQFGFRRARVHRVISRC